jgi:16S rRNA (guanine527-N7)-methyltransferase
MLELLQKDTAEWLGLRLDETQLGRFQLYYEELVDWNSRINLTAITEYEAVQRRHFLDALTLASPQLRGDPPGQPFDLSAARIIDIGAGAGFPGLPLKIAYPEIRLTLVDSVGKKTAFLKHLAAKLGFSDVEVLTGRAEELGQAVVYRERYDLATGRAVAAWSVLAEYCLPLCRVGGLFVAPKKAELGTELASAPMAAKLLGGKLRPTESFTLPGETEPRRLIVAEKVRPTPKTYPRRTGLPSKQPL